MMIKTHRRPSLSSPLSPREVSRPCPSCFASASSSSSLAGFETTPDDDPHHDTDDHCDEGDDDDHDDHDDEVDAFSNVATSSSMHPM